MIKAASDHVSFSGSQGAMLAARLDRPAGQPRAYALFAHCFTCSKDSVAANRIARALAGRGIAVLRFDFTGLGGSGGDFASSNFSSNVDDLVLAADWLRAHYREPEILIGHSLGGAAVLAAAGRIPGAAAVATIAAPSDPAHIRRSLAPHVDDIVAKGEAEISLAGRRFTIRRQFLDDISTQKLEDAISGMRKALLVLHAPTDQTVGIENASRIFAAAKHPKSFVSLDRADHLLTRREDADYIAEMLAAWASRYLPPEEVLPQALAEQGEVLVTEAGDGRFRQAILAGPHRLTADEPVSVGGDDTGPTPYDLLLAALGACTGMTLRMYAERKQLPLAKVTVRLRHGKIHATDCMNCETKDGMLDRIEREIAFDGELTAEQRSRLIEIADKCPVHRTLHSEVVIETRLSDTVAT